MFLERFNTVMCHVVELMIAERFWPLFEKVHTAHNGSLLPGNKKTKREWKLLLISIQSELSSLASAIVHWPPLYKGIHHYYTLHRLLVQIEVPSRVSIWSKKKKVGLPI